MSSLMHHGVKGQRWGVRRFQNKDGTRTAAGKKQEKTNRLIASTSKDYSSITKSLSDHDLKMLNYDEEEIKYMREHETLGHDHAEYGMVAHRVIQKDKNGTPVAYVDATGFTAQSLLTGKKAAKIISIDLATRAGDEYRGKGYAIAAGKKMVKWFDTYGYKDYEYMEWAAKEENVASQKVAEKLGFKPYYNPGPGWTLYTYEHKAKHTSIGGTMYIEGNALILGDSSYLEHHGIKGQRWGVRRFQNRDGSLTNAGRKRLGYATKGVTQTVGKAFKAGVKAGGKAVKAVKAHHEASEAKKKEKKKEKASKTRLGVMANKDLFTNEEIRKLNERFKLEDEMKMATLQKGVEIAKAVGVIAQNVGTVAKAYEDVTGTSLSPIKKAKQEAEAKEKAEDRKRKLAKEDAETKRAEDKEKRDIEDRERRIKFEDEDRVRKQAKEDADAQRAENAEKRAQAKEQRDSSMAVELQRKAKAAADEQEHKAVKAKAESRSAILDVLEKIDKIQDYDDDDHNNNNPPGGGIDTWNDDDYLNFFKKTGIIHSGFIDSDPIQNGVLFVDSSDGLSHHGVKGQRWGVRRFQNEDGSLTEKGRKHYEKALAKEKRKQVSSDAIRGTLERQHPFAVAGAAIMGAVAAGMSIAATGGASVAMIAAGSAISAAVSAGLTHVSYSASEAWEGRGTRMRSKKIAKYESMLKQSSMEEGMYHVENGTLFINAGEPYLEHHGVLGMKWGKHLRAGKGPADAPASAGGGGGEDDEKLKEMAKKAGMSVAEYKQKFASKIGGASKAIYNVAGGSHKTEADEYRKLSRDASNEARKYEASGNADLAKAASARRKGNTSAHSSYKTTGDNAKNEARKARERASALSEGARQEQARYEKSLAGRYDKMKADRARKKSIKKRQSIERALANGPVKAKPKKSLGKRLEEKLGVTHEKTNKPKQSKEAKRIENMYKNAARKDGMQAKRKKRVAKHSDDTNAVYTEGTRLVINSKWG